MKKEFLNEEKSILIYTCDNLREYFTEFTKYRKALRESEDWDKSFNRFYDGTTWAFKEDYGRDFNYRKNGRIVEFLYNDYNNDFEGKNGRIELELPIDLESPEWKFRREKVNQTLKEIWKTGELKNPYGLDLNWPKSSQSENGNKKAQEKKQLQVALQKITINSSPEKAQKVFERQIGFEEEKKKFIDIIYLYLATQGNFWPRKEIICYAGAPGMGKTTFIQTLSEAMGRPLQLINCSGQKEFTEFSILGNSNQPSLVAWAMIKKGCKNLIIDFEELEKIEAEQFQTEILKLFELYQKGEKLYDPYYQMDIDLSHVTFFANVNYPKRLAPQLINKVNVRRLKDFSRSVKVAISKIKKDEIKKKLSELYGVISLDIIPEKIITLLPDYIREAGIRQTERVLYKIIKEYIVARENNQEFSLGEPQQWLKKNVLPYQENFRPSKKHYWVLFPCWGIIWILFLAVIVKKIILKEKLHQTEKELK